jgi:hypothetical protein
VPAVAEGSFFTVTGRSVVPNDWDIVYVEQHVHIGAVNFSIDHYRDGKHIGHVCHGAPTYGTGGTTPGNETGYVVNMHVCEYSHPYSVKAGDELEMTAVYGGRTLPGGHAYHEGETLNRLLIMQV